MIKVFKQKINILTLGMLLAIGQAQNVKASKANDFFTTNEATLALRTFFVLPMVFHTDMGELTLTIYNDAKEENDHYMRAHNLSKHSDYLNHSHSQMLRYLEQVLEEEKDLTGELLAESNPHMSSPVMPTKKPRIQNNPIYPLAFQGMDSTRIDKFALPESVLTLEWKYEELENPRYTTSLNLFKDKSDFFAYVQNTLHEKFILIAKEIEEESFHKYRHSMYL